MTLLVSRRDKGMFEISLEKSHVIIKFSLKTRLNLSLVSFMRPQQYQIKHKIDVILNDSDNDAKPNKTS